METGEISLKLKRGKHTTRHAELFCIEKDTYLFDTPGFTALSLGDMPEEEIRCYYPEFSLYEGKCRFRECSHTHEPGCAVLKALEDHYIAQSRYQSYLSMMEDKDEGKYREGF
jgi:ribosome biogenesis GTPase